MSDHKQADAELLAFMAELDSEFGKKKKRGPTENEIARGLNKSWHAANPQIARTGGKAPEKVNPEDSTHWRPVAKVTHVIRQGCRCCNGWTDFIGGEYVRFVSVMPFGGEILRRAENCTNLFLYHSIEEPLEDIIEWHSQTVARCPGCIQVEQQAVEIWEAALEQERTSYRQQVLDITLPLPKSIKAKDTEITIEIEGEKL